MTDDIATFQRLNPFPAPNAFTPNHKAVLRDDKACMNLKSARNSYLGDIEYKALTTPTHYQKNFS